MKASLRISSVVFTQRGTKLSHLPCLFFDANESPKQAFTCAKLDFSMTNRLLITIANAVEWLKDNEKDKAYYKGVVRFLEEAASILKPAVEGLRGQDIQQTDQIEDEDSVLMTLNDLIDHIDYITNKDGMQMASILDKAKLRLDLARQTIRLESAIIPEIRVDLKKISDNVETALTEDTENIHLKTALVRLRGTMNDLSNV